MGVRFRLLGPVDVVVDGTEIPVPKGRLLTLLSGLLLRANQAVPVDQLARWLWEDAAPDAPRARATVQEYVRRLRRTVGSEDVVRTVHGGYLIEADEDSLDLLRFRTLTARGRAAAEAGEPHAAAERLTAALDLWRGPALSNVDSRTLHDDEVTHLTEQRLRVQEQWADALLHVGRHQQVIPELRRLTHEHPLREKPWELLLVALYRDHRQAEALAAYEEIRRILAEELGVDPGAGLRAVHQAILHGDPALEPSAEATPEPPRQLPADVSHFIGRDGALAALRRLAGERRPGRVSIAAIEGTAGVGKTALAVHFAHRVAGEFPDGQLFLNLRGYGPGRPVAPAAALETLLQAFGTRERIPADVDARAALWRTHTAGRRFLIVLDNARDTEQVRPLLPGAGSLALITSRTQLRGLIAREDATRVALSRFRPETAVELLASVAGADRIHDEPTAAHQIVHACARLPLAIRILGERIGRQPGTPLAKIVHELDDEQDRLTIFNLEDDEETNLHAVFNRSYRALDHDTATLFRLLGSLPVVDYTVPAAAAAAGLPIRATQVLMDRLTAAHLMERHQAHRYQFHDLMREFARSEAQRHEGHQAIDAASRRLLDWYLHTVVNVDRALNPARISDEPYPLPAGIRPLTFDTYGEASSWLDDERANLISAAGHALDRGIHQPVVWLGRELFVYLRLRAQYSADLITLYRTSLAAARQSGERIAEAFALNGLGVIHARLDWQEDAISCFHQALDIWRDAGEPLRVRQVLANLSTTYMRTGQTEQAIHHGLESLRMAQRHARAEDVAKSFGTLAQAYLKCGRHDEAVAHARRALDMTGGADMKYTAASAFHTLGGAFAGSGDLQPAAEHYQRALAMFRELDMQFEAAEVLVDLGDLHDRQGAAARARDCWQGALATLVAMRHPLADAVLDRLSRSG